MAGKIVVNGNKVTVDDLVYAITPAGAGQYKVSDEFGELLGYVTVRGKTIVADDYGVAGAPPLVQLGRAWLAAQEPAEAKATLPTKGFCRIATHEIRADAEKISARAYRTWLRSQPGIKASYLVLDPATGKAMSITLWQNQRAMEAAEAATKPAGVVEPPSSSVELYPMVEEP